MLTRWEQTAKIDSIFRWTLCLIVVGGVTACVVPVLLPSQITRLQAPLVAGIRNQIAPSKGEVAALLQVANDPLSTALAAESLGLQLDHSGALQLFGQ